MNKKNIIHFLNNFELYICDILLAVTIVVATLAVIMRYIFNDSLIWSEEVCRFSFVWISLLSTGYAVNNGGHLMVDVLTMFEEKIPGVIKGIQLVINIIWVAFCIYFAKEGFITAASSMQLSPALGIPMTLVYGAVPAGAIIMGIRVLQKTYIDFIASRKAGKAEEV
ncbi:MAG: TRAP transporter small permease [Firmicutes bacterium]|nr:TRAP transporter small permease [Bacillota bacterium]